MSCEEKTGNLYQHVAPAQNSAVALCYESYIRALDEAEEKKMYTARALKLAQNVYRKALPPLSGRENIRDFIACVAHAMLLKIIEPEEATRLLYAAQVAQSGANREQPKAKNS
ncbi:MAG: hypothetical protein WB561_11880 [Terracidiphilus sp.]